MSFSRKVFWGATRPRRDGILPRAGPPFDWAEPGRSGQVRTGPSSSGQGRLQHVQLTGTSSAAAGPRRAVAERPSPGTRRDGCGGGGQRRRPARSWPPKSWRWRRALDSDEWRTPKMITPSTHSVTFAHTVHTSLHRHPAAALTTKVEKRTYTHFPSLRLCYRLVPVIKALIDRKHLHLKTGRRLQYELCSRIHEPLTGSR